MACLETKRVRRACVCGSGAFGTSLACVLAQKADEVKVWHMDEAQSQVINQERENKLFLRGIPLPANVQFSADVAGCVEGSEIVLFVVPTQFLRGFLTKHGRTIQRLAPVDAHFVMCSKGIEGGTLLFPGEILAQLIPEHPVTVVAGPSFALEIGKHMFTNVCVAAADIERARKVQNILTTPDGMFRCWATTDTVGCEVASAVKNVLAIASGTAQGLGLGLNARAALITRGILEIRDMTLALGGTGEAVFGLAGIGDLLLTCSSTLSRNFTVGLRLGKGESLAEIKRTSKAVAEGVATAEPLELLARKHRLKLHVCHHVYRVLYTQATAKERFDRLRTTPLFDEGLPPLVPAHHKTPATPSKL